MLQRLLFWTIAAPMDEKTAPFGTVLVYAEDDALASHLGRGAQCAHWAERDFRPLPRNEPGDTQWCGFTTRVAVSPLTAATGRTPLIEIG